MSVNAFEIPSHVTKRRTMIKDRVGCVRSSVMDLPPSDHVYGRKLPTDQEGAGALISSWVTANPSLFHEVGKKNVYSNVLALKHGYITAKGMRQYAKEHPNIRMKESLTEDSIKVRGPHEGPFGIKTAVPDVPFSNIIQGRFVNYANDDGDYPDVSCIKKKGAMPPPKSTVASDLLLKTRKEVSEETPGKPRFIISKFKNVKSTMEKYPGFPHNKTIKEKKVDDIPATEVAEEPNV